MSREQDTRSGCVEFAIFPGSLLFIPAIGVGCWLLTQGAGSQASIPQPGVDAQKPGVTAPLPTQPSHEANIFPTATPGVILAPITSVDPMPSIVPGSFWIKGPNGWYSQTCDVWPSGLSQQVQDGRGLQCFGEDVEKAKPFLYGVLGTVVFSGGLGLYLRYKLSHPSYKESRSDVFRKSSSDSIPSQEESPSLGHGNSESNSTKMPDRIKMRGIDGKEYTFSPLLNETPEALQAHAEKSMKMINEMIQSQREAEKAQADRQTAAQQRATIDEMLRRAEGEVSHQREQVALRRAKQEALQKEKEAELKQHQSEEEARRAQAQQVELRREEAMRAQRQVREAQRLAQEEKVSNEKLQRDAKRKAEQQTQAEAEARRAREAQAQLQREQEIEAQKRAQNQKRLAREEQILREQQARAAKRKAQREAEDRANLERERREKLAEANRILDRLRVNSVIGNLIKFIFGSKKGQGDQSDSNIIEGKFKEEKKGKKKK